MSNRTVSSLLADSRLSFLNQQNETVLRLAKEAIKLAGSPFKLDESEPYEISSDDKDQINRLYIGAYTLKKDFEKVIEYARVLQASEGIQMKWFVAPEIYISTFRLWLFIQYFFLPN